MKTISLLIAVVAIIFATPGNAQEFKANTAKSTIKWEGKKIGGAHDGHISLKEGTFTVKNNQITSGTFVIDMNSMTNDDIESDEYRGKLIGHLKSDDFFGVNKYPTAKLVITKSGKFKNNAATVTGDLTIKGKTLPIEFEVKRSNKTYISMLTIDRAKYDIRYGSKSFFDNLGDKVIYDDFTLEINLVVQ
ncbi:YceI family protein [Labilibacter sediminis]|nr:YceI family protein [Labilibacter sediminis]